MRRQVAVLTAFGVTVVAGGSFPVTRAQEAGANGAEDFWPVRGNVYMLAGAGGNITASVGSDGVLLVDTGPASTSGAVSAALARLQERLAFGDIRHLASSPEESFAGVAVGTHPPPGPIRYVINTSARIDHSGANADLAAPHDGHTAAAVIAQENVLIQLVGIEASFERLPTETFASGEHTLGRKFNGDAIRLAHMPAAATGGDTIVYFRDADVISTGDVFSMETFPVIDVDNGGSIDGVIRALNYILNLTVTDGYGEGGTLVIPGHGRLADTADVGYYRDMLTIVRDQMRSAIDAGMTLEQIGALRPTLGYEGRFGSEEGGWTTEMFLEAVYRSLTETPQ